MWGIVLNIPSARIMGTCYIRCGSQRKRNMKTHGVVYGLPFALLLLFIRSSCGDVGQLLPRKSFLEDFTKGQWISVPYPARVGTCSPQGWLNTSEVLKTLNIEEVTFVVKLKVLEGVTNIRNDTTFLVGVTSGGGVSRIFKATGRWTNGSEYLTATKLIKLNSDGTKFGIRLLDGKYCVNVFAINISYNFCPKKLFKRNGNSVEFPRTYSPPIGSFPKKVEGTCKHSKGKPVAHCKSDGSWEFKDSMHYCDCTPGQIAVGKSECIDLENVVQDMKVIRQSNTRAALSWRSNVPSANYSVECGRCVLDNCTGVCSEITRIFWQKEQRIGVNITGLKQASYNITVVAWIRGVNGSRNKTAKKSIMLEELPRKVRNLNYSFQGHHNIVLSWQPPENAQPNGISYEVTCEASCNREVSSERCPELQYSPSPDNLLQTNVTITGFGQYGKRYCFTVYTKNRWYMSDDGRVEWNFGSIYFTAKSKEEIRDDSKGFNVVDVIIGVCVLIVAVIVSVIVTRCYNRWKARKHGVIFDAENPEQLYNGDVPISMKATTSYVDPSNYESIKNVLRQFTKKLSERNLKTEEIIGEGEFGVVWKGYLDAPGQERITVAVKSLRSGLSAKLRRDFLAEASVMGQFKDPNVISLHGVVVKKNTVKIVMEYMENGSLDKYLERNNGRLTTLQLLGMARGIASGMKYLSGRNFIHRDLAARNILVDRNLCCKVSDFGLTREICETSNYETRGGKIPIRWTAPEVIKHKKSFIASDVWSYGVVLWEIMSFGQRPYWEWDNFQVLQEIETGYRLPAPLKCPKSVHCLMLQCWEKERTKRPLFSYIVDQLDEWIRSPETVNHSPAAVKRNKVEIVDSLSPIQQWLDSIKMGRYVSNFITAGYDSLSQVTHLTEEDLREMGITLVGHRHKIHQSIPLIAKST